MTLRNKTDRKLLPSNEGEILFRGKTFEIARQHWVFCEGSKTRKIALEIARRSPGVRVIAREGRKILLTHEYRAEHKNWDWRLPGGKVFDSLGQFAESKPADNLKNAKAAAKKELLEETGMNAKKLKFLQKSVAGTSVEWDLYYFEATGITPAKSGRAPEDGEIIRPEWKTLQEAKQMCLDGSIKEDRSVGALLKYVLKNE